MKISEVFKTAAGTTGLLVISGLAAAHGNTTMAIGAAATAVAAGALVGLQAYPLLSRD